jgi:hypothetical protein
MCGHAQGSRADAGTSVVLSGRCCGGKVIKRTGGGGTVIIRRLLRQYYVSTPCTGSLSADSPTNQTHRV